MKRTTNVHMVVPLYLMNSRMSRITPMHCVAAGGRSFRRTRRAATIKRSETTDATLSLGGGGIVEHWYMLCDGFVTRQLVRSGARQKRLHHVGVMVMLRNVLSLNAVACCIFRSMQSGRCSTQPTIGVRERAPTLAWVPFPSYAASSPACWRRVPPAPRRASRPATISAPATPASTPTPAAPAAGLSRY